MRLGLGLRACWPQIKKSVIVQIIALQIPSIITNDQYNEYTK